MTSPLRDHVAVVTGAGRGLGRAVAEALAEAGARVALVDVTINELGQAEAELPGHGVVETPETRRHDFGGTLGQGPASLVHLRAGQPGDKVGRKSRLAFQPTVNPLQKHLECATRVLNSSSSGEL